jgi:hypothetical protein
MKISLFAAMLAAAVASGSAAAGVIDYNFSGNGGLAGQYSFTSSGVGVTASAGVRVLGRRDEAGIFPLLGQHDGGLGVGGYPFDLNHGADNLGGDEYVKFVFERPVQVQSVTVAYQYQPASLCFPFVGCLIPSVGDADASFQVGNPSAENWQSLPVNASHRNSGWFEYTYTLTDLAADEVFRFGARHGESDDAFKILGLSVLVNEVPAPAPLMLLGAGLLALGARGRRATASSAGASR